MPHFSDTERRLIELLKVGVNFSAKNLVFPNDSIPLANNIGLLSCWMLKLQKEQSM